MPGLTGFRLWGALGALLALAAFAGWVMRIDHLRGEWKGKYETLNGEAAKLLASIRAESDNPKLKWKDAPDQVEAIAASRREWKLTAALQSRRIDELANETARLKALSEDLRRKAEAAIAKRNSLAERLEQQALTPGERSDCVRQLMDVEAALDAVWESGL